MQTLNLDLEIQQGATFAYSLRWFDADPVHQRITAVEAGWPTVITVPAHGLPAGRSPVWITNVISPRGLNSESPGGCTPRWATPIDADTLAIDHNTGNERGSYAGNGVLTSNPAHDLAGYTARLQARLSPQSPAVLLELTTENGGIALGASPGQIDLLVTASSTAAIEWQAAVYDLLLTSADGRVTRLAQGSVTVSPDVTRADA